MPAARPRFSKRGHVYSDPSYEKYKTLIKFQILLSTPKKTEEPLAGVFIFRFKANKGVSKKKALALLGTWRKTSKDTDNLIKPVMDAAQGLVFHNDNQVIPIVAHCLYDYTDSIEFWFLSQDLVKIEVSLPETTLIIK